VVYLERAESVQIWLSLFANWWSLVGAQDQHIFYLHMYYLKKDYHSVSHNAIWIALEKLGVSEETIRIIRSFHHARLEAQDPLGWGNRGGNPGAEWSQTGLLHGISSF
jgi:hypothetical protein